MASVRVPIRGKQLLQYVQNDPDAHYDIFFRSYAHLVMFAASMGYQQGDYDEAVQFCRGRPGPISFDVFKNSGLDEYAYIIAIAHEQTHGVLDDDTAVCRTIEGYASGGFRRLEEIYEDCGGQGMLDTIIHDALKQK